VIVVDDASLDDARDVLDDADERVRFIRNERPVGVAAARNLAVHEAAGTWVAFLDDDDIWAPDKLERQLRALRRTGARWSACSAVYVDGSSRLLRYGRVPDATDLANMLLAVNVIPGGASGVLCDRELAIEAGGFDSALAVLADWDLWIRLAIAAPVACVEQALFAYTVDAGSMSTDTAAAEREYRYVESKYEQERVDRGITMNASAWASYVADMHRRSGPSVAATRAYVRAAVLRPSFRRAGWAVASALPGATAVRRVRSHARIPHDERRRVAQWIAAADGRQVRR